MQQDQIAIKKKNSCITICKITNYKTKKNEPKQEEVPKSSTVLKTIAVFETA